MHVRNIPLGRDVKIPVLARGTPGLSGADIANLVNEAALLAARRNVNRVWMEDFENAKDKVMMGTERKSVLISKEEKHQTAVHEAGHVLVAKLTPGSDPVHKVTIIPRGRALGVTHYLPMDEKHSYSRTYLNRVMVALLGGRAAEKIVFNELSTGAGNDIERASEIARKMVCEWGMSSKLGPVSLGGKDNEVFLGRDFTQQRSYSERTAQEVDNEIRRIVTDAEQQAEKLIRNSVDKLKLLSDGLLEREILDGHEIDVLLRDGKLPPQRKKSVKARRRPTRSRKPKQAQPPQPKKEKPPQKVAAKTKITGSESGTSQTRRQLAKEYGVVSSRDLQPRRRPYKSKQTQNKQEPPKKESKPPKPKEEPKPQVAAKKKPTPKRVDKPEPKPKMKPPVKGKSKVDTPVTTEVTTQKSDVVKKEKPKPKPRRTQAKKPPIKEDPRAVSTDETKPNVAEKTAAEPEKDKKPIKRGRKPKAVSKESDKSEAVPKPKDEKPKPVRRGRKPKTAGEKPDKTDAASKSKDEKPKPVRRGRKPKTVSDKSAEPKVAPKPKDSTLRKTDPKLPASMDLFAKSSPRQSGSTNRPEQSKSKDATGLFSSPPTSVSKTERKPEEAPAPVRDVTTSNVTDKKDGD